MMIVECGDADFAALIAGVAPANYTLPEGGVERSDVLMMLRDLSNRIRPAFAPASWMAVEAGKIVGLCSLVKEPSAGGIDIGYGVALARRQQGIASACVGLVVDWAGDDERVSEVRAETSTLNIPSQRVLERNGFVRAGTRFDEEDGDLICWRVATVSRREVTT